MKVLEEIKNYIGIYPSLIAKNTGLTYSHVVKIVNWLEKKGVVVLQRTGRKVHIKPSFESLEVFKVNSEMLQMIREYNLEE